MRIAFQPIAGLAARHVLLLLGGLLVALCWSPGPGQASPPINATVIQSDCRKCHDDIVFDLQRGGGAHTELCVDCHRGHPPADTDVIPPCSRCHNNPEESHFTLADCMSCHLNPHTPLQIQFTKNLTAPCESCHAEQLAQLQEHPSIHTKLACTACHTFHGQLQPCQNCHLPHSSSMDSASCVKCHRAHMPLVVTYGLDIAPEDCGSCHSEVYNDMAGNLSKHRNVSCVSCHTKSHGTIPACNQCHRQPHPQEIHDKFPDCGECHGHAHSLQATDASTSIFLRYWQKEPAD